jgi:single-stranded-DNA-specific exonuclease
MAIEIVGKPKNKIIIIKHKDFHEGVIGLVAGKLTENHYRPSIVIGIGDDISKASARSVSGVNIINLIREKQQYLINAGGHPMAAGFTIKTQNLAKFEEELTRYANQAIDNALLTPEIDIECELTQTDISWELFEKISQMEPYGMANRKPIFAIRNIKVLEKYAIGKEKNHLKLILPSSLKNQTKIDALWFGQAEKLETIKESIDIAFTLEENSWKGKSSLQFMIKDIQ